MLDAIAVLEEARAGDVQALGDNHSSVADAVRLFAAGGDGASALELVGRVWRIWLSRAEIDEGSKAAAAALEAPGASETSIWRTRALYADGVFAFRSGDTTRSRQRNDEALRIARETGDVKGECDALTGLARVALREGRYQDVVKLALEGRERARSSGEREAEAAPLHLHAAGVRLLQRYADAKDLYLESLELNRAMGRSGWVSMEQQNLGWVEIHLGDADQAAFHFRARDDTAGDDPLAGAWSDLSWAGVGLLLGDLEQARWRFAAGTRKLQELGQAPDPDDAFELDWLKGRITGATPSGGRKR